MTRGSAEDRQGRRLALAVGAANLAVLALMAFTQWAAWGGVEVVRGVDADPGRVLRDALVVAAANLAYGVLVLGGFFALRPLGRSWPVRVALAVVVAGAAGIPRVWALTAVPSVVWGAFYNNIDWAAALVGAVVALVGACLVHDLVRRSRREERRRREQVVRSARTIAALEAEEASTRRAIAEQLHGQVQNRLVVVTSGLDGVAHDRRESDPALAAMLEDWAEVLEDIRERDVRALSHDLFPAGADVSTVAAVRTLLDRLPATASATLTVGETYGALIAAHPQAAPMAERLIAVYTVEEALTNALKHGRARRVEVRMDARPTPDPHRWVMEVAVADDGVGLPPGRSQLHGLARHAARIEGHGGTLELVPGGPRGAVLRFELPFTLPESLGGDPA